MRKESGRMDKKYYCEKIEHFIAEINDEKELKRICDYCEIKWRKSESALSKFSDTENIKKQCSAMSIAQYRRNIHECIYSIHEKDGLDRIFNLAMRIKQAQSEKSEFSVKDMLYSLIDDIEDDEKLGYVIFFLRGLNGNSKKNAGEI